MNDPNGLVFIEGVYHLFYQHFPDSNIWGPMHWGHAISTDLVHWEHKPVGLYPDEHGYIYSGSAVYDSDNTSGLGTSDNPPVVAIFTYHDPSGEKAGKIDFQNQGIAFSLDNGETWKKYSGNPVLKNPGTRDFRDPRVIWHEPSDKWIMVLAAGDHVSFYSSTDLIRWSFESDFGSRLGAHGGVWECPDLFKLELPGVEKWVLLVSINPGGFNGGSATQYFIGEFTGKYFMADSPITRWLDYGMDNYAGVTWSNTGSRRIFIGWMSNWLYANKVPTTIWRSAMTLPRELNLVKTINGLELASMPVPEIYQIRNEEFSIGHFLVESTFDLSNQSNTRFSAFELSFLIKNASSFKVRISNSIGDSLVVGYHGFKLGDNRFYIDRRGSGETDFAPEFAGIHFSPRRSLEKDIHVQIFFDVSSVEFFADHGQTVMTDIFFPDAILDKIEIIAAENLEIADLKLYGINSIWD
ncbi:MAG TPA: glycoside hydrolase family 32 protein [Cyclobacteriaceae bacterium]|nr:glycoside hydrolase family 32 protein [Cyclobacteriaceae bacterium]